MRGELGDKYVDELRTLYAGRVPGGAKRVGLLATNSIRMVGNRPILDQIQKSGGIFMAWSDRPWVLDGAAVRVSMVGFDDGSQKEYTLDGHPVSAIHADLTASADVVSALPLLENEELCFLGVMKGGPFDLTAGQAQTILTAPLNPNGRPNADVVKRRMIGRDIVRASQDGWVIDFVDRSEQDAALYELPFEYVREHVKPLRDVNNRKRMRERWWLHGENRPGLRRALKGLSRCIVTPEVAKYRVFIWMSTDVVPDHKLHVIARDDDYFFGVLQSRIHEIWSLRLGSTLEDRPSYNSDTIFLTFPFPWRPGNEPSDPKLDAIALAARKLVEKRDAWLAPMGATKEELKKRTLTNLYNSRPTWLDEAHRKLDEAVFDAYGWPHTISNSEITERLLALNQRRASDTSRKMKKQPKSLT